MGLGTFGATTGNYLHVEDHVVNLKFGKAKSETETVNYETLTAAYNDTVGDGATGVESCSNVRCHNGVITPAFDLAGGPSTPDIGCGKCHNETWTAAGTGPLPTGSAGVAGSHAKHADNITDCQACHAGATAYTVRGGPNHQNLSVNLGGTYLGTYVPQGTGTAGVNFNGTYAADSGTCSALSCHNNGSDPSTAWGTTGLSCNDCHYYDVPGATTSAANAAHARPLSTSHGDHFNAASNIDCTACHGSPLPTNAAHIDGTTTLLDKAVAALDEATVTRTATTYSYGAADAGGVNNRCTGGIALGCHATGTPDWDVAIGATACTACHTDTTTSSVNPVSGLHGLTAGSMLTGNPHDGSFDDGVRPGRATARRATRRRLRRATPTAR